LDDLAVSAKDFLNNAAGSVLVTFGQAAPTLPWDEYLLLRADLVIESKVDNRNFARTLALGDLDGDGLADLAIAGYFEGAKSLNRGGVAIYRGDPSRRTALRLEMEKDPPDLIVLSAADYDEFGLRLLIDDLDEDGAAELIVAAPYAEYAPGEMAGRVDVLRGGPDLLTGEVRDLADDPPEFSVGGGEWSGNLGLSLAAGPLETGAARLLWIGDPAAWPEERINAGAVIGVAPVWEGEKRRISAEEAEVVIYNAAEYWGLGSAVGISHANGRGVLWMGAANASGDDLSGGALLALETDRLAPAGQPTDLAQTAPSAVFFAEADGDMLGNALLIGDLDFSGRDDVAAAAWYALSGERVDAGKVYLFRDPFTADVPDDDDDDDNDDNDNNNDNNDDHDDDDNDDATPFSSGDTGDDDDGCGC